MNVTGGGPARFTAGGPLGDGPKPGHASPHRTPVAIGVPAVVIATHGVWMRASTTHTTRTSHAGKTSNDEPFKSGNELVRADDALAGPLESIVLLFPVLNSRSP